MAFKTKADWDWIIGDRADRAVDAIAVAEGRSPADLDAAERAELRRFAARVIIAQRVGEDLPFDV